MTLLLESALRAWFIITVASVLALLVRSASADLRRRVWIAGLVGSACLPIAAWMAPAHSRVFGAALATAVAYAPGLTSDIVTSASASRTATWLVVLWASGALAVLARLVIGLWNVRRLSRNIVVDTGVAYSSEIDTPVTWGFRRSTILLPEYMREWPDEKRDVVLRHERAHVEQHDWAWQIVVRLVCAAYWFNPLVWVAAHQLAREMENAADDFVLRAGADAPAYANALVEIARRMKGAGMSGAVAMTGRNSLESRVRKILDRSRPRRRAARVAAVIFAAVIAAAVVGVSGPVAHAQQTRAYHVGDDGVVSPVPLTKVIARYTDEAKDRKIQGDVLLTAEVTEEGGIENIEVAQSLDPETGLDASAVEALKQWTFAPGTKDGQPVRVAVTIDMRFTLR
jgi:TonB family protein